jgi:hypothetical protein
MYLSVFTGNSDQFNLTSPPQLLQALRVVGNGGARGSAVTSAGSLYLSDDFFDYKPASCVVDIPINDPGRQDFLQLLTSIENV